MTTDELIVLVCTAIQPHVDRDAPNPLGVAEAVAATRRLFEEQPNVRLAFEAAVLAVVDEARRGWRREFSNESQER